MRSRDASERKEHVEALTIRYILGEISEPVLTASLRGCCNADEIRHILMMNRADHRSSLPYRRGDVA